MQMVSRKSFGFAALVFIGYSWAVIIAEMTLGNPEFPLTAWRFTTVQCWQWSLPVHALGFIWILGCHHMLRGQPLVLPVVMSVLYFFGAESANWYLFRFFDYSDGPLGPPGSFWLIIIMYTSLCAVCVYLLRWRVS
jgi:hypothetical protein